MHRVWGRASSGSKATGLGDKALWCWRIFVRQIQNLIISKHNDNFLWSFSPTSELRMIWWRHNDRCQVLSTVNHCLLIPLNVQLCAQHDDDWVGCNVSQSLLVLTMLVVDSCGIENIMQDVPESHETVVCVSEFYYVVLAIHMCLFVCLSICHTLVLCQNCWT